MVYIERDFGIQRSFDLRKKNCIRNVIKYKKKQFTHPQKVEVKINE